MGRFILTHQIEIARDSYHGTAILSAGCPALSRAAISKRCFSLKHFNFAKGI